MLKKGARNSSAGSVLGLLSCSMQGCGFEPPLRRIFLVEGIFSLEFPWVLTPFLKDSKDPDIHVLDRQMPARKTHPACTNHEDGM